MHLRSLEISGFKSFAKKTSLEFQAPITAIVGPNGSGKSNVAESFRFVLGEQSMKSLRGKRGEDLIWSGSGNVGKSNRGSVKLLLDNHDRMLNIDFKEVMIERVVHRDGTNEYLINGSRVRLRDIMELSAHAHIGASGHHIISQGEADRILNASMQERRVIIEEALGLKIYQFKKQESEKKLLKTEENMRSVESLRQEIAPHMKFLKRQVEKLQKAEEMKVELRTLCLEYFKRESVYLSVERERIAGERREPQEEKIDIEKRLAEIKMQRAQDVNGSSKHTELVALEERARSLRHEKEKISRELGRIEGVLDMLDRERGRRQEALQAERRLVAFPKVEKFLQTLEDVLERATRETCVFGVEIFVAQIREKIRQFLEEETATHHIEREMPDMTEYGAFLEEKKKLEEALARITEEEKKASDVRSLWEHDAAQEKQTWRETEQSMFELIQKEHAVRATLGLLQTAEDDRARAERDFKRDLGEVAMIIGREVISYATTPLSDEHGNVLEDTAIAAEERDVQRERRRMIERVRIRLEEVGGGTGSEVKKECDAVFARDAFLARELEDLHVSAKALRELMADLDRRLEEEFKTGVAKINTQFQEYFSMMFGGGAASLSVAHIPKRRPQLTFVDEIPESESSLDTMAPEEGASGMLIEVHLPRKRVHNLDMLSGGERALTSIALIFAISQVNPSPFLILDETDAALDEANSRKYGDMIESLSKHSQLILITHNRETMSRASILYGVTMGGDGISQLLSVRFDEAVAVAK